MPKAPVNHHNTTTTATPPQEKNIGKNAASAKTWMMARPIAIDQLKRLKYTLGVSGARVLGSCGIGRFVVGVSDLNDSGLPLQGGCVVERQ